jgi:hypothetical protein
MLRQKKDDADAEGTGRVNIGNSRHYSIRSARDSPRGSRLNEKIATFSLAKEAKLSAQLGFRKKSLGSFKLGCLAFIINLLRQQRDGTCFISVD